MENVVGKNRIVNFKKEEINRKKIASPNVTKHSSWWSG